MKRVLEVWWAGDFCATCIKAEQMIRNANLSEWKCWLRNDMPLLKVPGDVEKFILDIVSEPPLLIGRQSMCPQSSVDFIVRY